ncbi:phytoene desaturase [Edaphosphingomonas haloaromaticamans]|uniref:Phytoene dehydrogenase n=1 Tax=Edaphosphingomonas haloaromaticamans TaxID=653954 RepID=A0A1S1HNC0_9SPHN|nr:phytoene desaturase [Sphingomonas haloaromaticamans]OHT21930.1 Phytoene desaturase (lycopene-forming) [Sphingomonas haloaromaticamans]
MRTAAVIGAGFGGLALAIRLQSAGVDTTLIEGRDQPGGRAYAWEKGGFIFDAGPTIITDPDCLRELWALSGRVMDADVSLLPVSPYYRLNWPDGTSFDHAADEAQLMREIARISPADAAGYQQFLQYAAGTYAKGYLEFGHVPFLDMGAMAKALPMMARYQAWRSLHAMVSRYVKDEKLRQAFSFQTLMLGGNPFTATALYALIHKLEKDGGLWFPRGGTNRLVAAMAAHFQRLGGTLRLGDPVVRIETLGDAATGLATASGWHQEFGAIASNADPVHSYRDLLGHTVRGQKAARALEAKRHSPSAFILHFGVKGSWPGIPHHMILFGPRYEGLLKDIFEHGVLAEDMLILLNHPTVTDPSLAPEGCSVFQAVVPVPHLGKLPIDWNRTGPILAQRILAEIERRLMPGLADRVMTMFHYMPTDFAADLNAHMGTGYGLEPTLLQGGWLRVHNRDDRIANLYFAGAATHPGAGIPGVLGSAKATAALMLADMA